MHILIIDPDEYYHSRLKETLADLGQVNAYKDFFPAARSMKEFQPDAVITELLFPEYTGYDVLEALSDQTQSTKPKVVIYSQVENPEDIKRALSMGAKDYFVKGRHTIQDVKEALVEQVNIPN